MLHENKSYRPDIDGLRAVAVLSVLGFHAFPAEFPGGFIGVDIFFVISGYLISSIIFDGVDARSFNFAVFYARRVKRIFPALAIVLFSVYALGWYFLLPTEFKALGKNIAGGAAFASNFVSLGEAGYFDTDSNLKPLLHLWSLGIEEQFYLIWPLFVVLICKLRGARAWLIGTLLVLSFFACISMVHRDDLHAFYLPYTRAWELLAGALLAVFRHHLPRVKGIHLFGFFGAGLLILGELIINSRALFPSWSDLLPVVGTVLIVASGSKSWVNEKILSQPWVVFVGKISYPLYLWHWPLLVFLRISTSSPPSAAERISILFVSAVLAWFTYRLIEKPIRFGVPHLAKIVIPCVAISIAGYIGLNAFQRDGLAFRAVARESIDIERNLEWPYWASADCSKRFGTDPVIDPCEISNKSPQIMLLGDSHANHFYPGLVATNTARGVINAGTCIPLKSVVFGALKNASANQCAGKDIFARDAKILDMLPSVKIVVLAGWMKVNLDAGLEHPDFRSAIGQLTFTSTLSEDAGLSREETIFRGLSRTVTYLEKKGIKVVYVRDTPFIETDLKEYCQIGSRFRAEKDCFIKKSEVDEFRKKETLLVSELRIAHPKLVIFDPDDALCDKNRCYLMRDRKLLYRDRSHLSVAGSDMLGQFLTQRLF